VTIRFNSSKIQTFTASIRIKFQSRFSFLCREKGDVFKH
jgi:hypothetical protein